MPVESDGPKGFAPGSVLGARFHVLRFLAQGGMGEVYEARDLELGGTVALKIVRPEVARALAGRGDNSPQPGLVA